MQATLIKLHNFMAFENLEVNLGKMNVFRGPNGAGKTTIKNAICSVIDGGHDGTLLRNGETEGEIVLVFDNGARIRKRITPTDSTVQVFDEFGTNQSKAQTWIRTHLDGIATNPIAFILADEKKRLSILLDTLPLELTDTQKQVLRMAGATEAEVNSDRHPLDLIASAQGRVYDLRTGINRNIKEKELTAKRLRQALPPNMGTIDFLTEIREKKAVIESLQLERSTRISAIDQFESREVAKAERTFGEEKAKLQADMDAEIARVRAKFQELANTARNDRDAIVDAAKASANADRNTVYQDIDTALQTHKQDVAALEAKQEETARARFTLDEAEKCEAGIAEDRQKSEQLTETLELLDATRAEMLRSLPAGLEVRDGKIYRNGVIFDRLNTAQQIEMAIAIAKLRNSPLMVIDGAERLDADAFAEFERQAAESGLQSIVLEVSRDPNIKSLTHTVTNDEEVLA